MISHHALRCIFVHIPKTGGTSIEDVIWPERRAEEDLWMGFVSARGNKYQTGGLQHLLARQIRQEVGPKIFANYFKFAMVRKSMGPGGLTVLLHAHPHRPSRIDRDDGRRLRSVNSLSLIDGQEHVQWLPQFEFLHDTDGSLLVDFVGRFEQLETHARIIFNRLGLGGRALPHANASQRGPYREYFDASSKRQVERLYGQDIEAFRYEF